MGQVSSNLFQKLLKKSVFYAQIHPLLEKKEKTGRRGLSVLCSFTHFGGMRLKNRPDVPDRRNSAEFHDVVIEFAIKKWYDKVTNTERIYLWQIYMTGRSAQS